MELQFRELALHAPSIAVFADGRLVGPLLRGYRTAEEYGEFFDRVLPNSSGARLQSGSSQKGV